VWQFRIGKADTLVLLGLIGLIGLIFRLLTALSFEMLMTSPSAEALLSKWYALNEECRGGSGDEAETYSACDQRSVYANVQAIFMATHYPNAGGSNQLRVPLLTDDAPCDLRQRLLRVKQTHWVHKSVVRLPF
jgi:hypothetical protein